MKVNEETIRLIQSDYEHSDITREEICEKYGISRSTLSNYVKAFGFEPRQRHLMYPHKPEKNHTQTVLCTKNPFPFRARVSVRSAERISGTNP